jgi:putative addiction module component (TIGR02574 family)
MNKTLLKELLELTPAERIDLAVELWDSVAPDKVPPLTAEQMDELDRRLTEHDKVPGRGTSWEEVRARLRARYE